jgi:hypothetical protein
MRKPKELIDFDDNWTRAEKEGILVVDLYKHLPRDFVDEYNNLVEVVNTLIEIAKVSSPLYENMFEEES